MKYKSVFISDVHLGLKGIPIDTLTRFLKENEFENIFLVGDIIDLWKLRRAWYWPEENNKFIRTILKLSKKCNVVYITGNHDEFLRTITGFNLGNIQILDEYIYETDSKKVLIVHGDLFDTIVKSKVRLAKLGAIGYELLLKTNGLFNFIRKHVLRRGHSHWSFSSYIKRRVKNAVKYINRYEETLAGYAKANGCEIVICGHIHTTEVKYIDDVLYINCGDFVESLTVVVESKSAGFNIINFGEQNKKNG